MLAFYWKSGVHKSYNTRLQAGSEDSVLCMVELVIW